MTFSNVLYHIFQEELLLMLLALVLLIINPMKCIRDDFGKNLNLFVRNIKRSNM